MQPQNPGYHAFAPNYGPQGPQQPPPAAPPVPPYGQPQMPPIGVPQPFIPQQPPPQQIPGYGPPMGPPQGFGTQVPYQPPTNPWEGADNASVEDRTPLIQIGNHVLAWKKFERVRTRGGLDLTIITCTYLASDNPQLVGQLCAAIKQNMNIPLNKGGSNVAFTALAKLIFPAMGYNAADPAQKAQIDGFLANKKFSAWLLELDTKGTVEGRPMVDRQFGAQVTAGKRTEKTPVGKEPFPFTHFVPYSPPIFQ